MKNSKKIINRILLVGFVILVFIKYTTNNTSLIPIPLLFIVFAFYINTLEKLKTPKIKSFVLALGILVYEVLTRFISNIYSLETIAVIDALFIINSVLVYIIFIGFLFFEKEKKKALVLFPLLICLRFLFTFSFYYIAKNKKTSKGVYIELINKSKEDFKNIKIYSKSFRNKFIDTLYYNTVNSNQNIRAFLDLKEYRRSTCVLEFDRENGKKEVVKKYFYTGLPSPLENTIKFYVEKDTVIIKSRMYLFYE